MARDGERRFWSKHGVFGNWLKRSNAASPFQDTTTLLGSAAGHTWRRFSNSLAEFTFSATDPLPTKRDYPADSISLRSIRTEARDGARRRLLRRSSSVSARTWPPTCFEAATGWTSSSWSHSTASPRRIDGRAGLRRGPLLHLRQRGQPAPYFSTLRIFMAYTSPGDSTK